MVHTFIAVSQEDSMKKSSNFGKVLSVDLGTKFAPNLYSQGVR